MAQPFVGDTGVIRLSPLEKAVAKRSDPTKAPGGASSSIDGPSGANFTELPADTTPAQVQDAMDRAEAGDQSAIDWLKGLGIAAGAAGAGYATYRILRNRGAKKGGKFGADNITTDAAPKTSSKSVVKTSKPVDLFIDLPTSQSATKPAGYIDAPFQEAPKLTADDMKLLTTKKPALPPARAAIQAIRRLP